MTHAVRRVVTGKTADGKSVFVSDEQVEPFRRIVDFLTACRRDRIDERWQWVELRRGRQTVHAVGRGGLGLGHHHRHGVADEPHLSAGQQAPSPRVWHVIAKGEVVRGHHRDDPGDGERRGGR